MSNSYQSSKPSDVKPNLKPSSSSSSPGDADILAANMGSLQPAPIEDLSAFAGLDEEIARAEVYGLLAQLFYSPPLPSLLEDIRVSVTQAPNPGAYLEEPWRDFVGVCRDMAEPAVRGEFDALFSGVGKPEIDLFASQYISGFLNEKPLAKLRQDLMVLGLTRDEATMPETEDHLAYLFEVMRYLIAAPDVELANLSQQQLFFSKHLHPWVDQALEKIISHPKARFYAALAQFTQAFMAIERQAFELSQV